MLGSSNRFHNLAPRQFCIRNPRLFPNHPNHFYTFFFSCTFVLGTLSLLLPTSFHLQIGQLIHARIFPRDWINFPSAERLVVEIRSCCRAIFINLTKKYRLKVGFGNYWRCSNVCGTVLVVTYSNDLPRQNHKQKG